jgi:prophage maintenance system killer protein
MACALLFLEANGLTFEGDDVLLAVLLAEAAEQDQDTALKTIDNWLRKHITPIPP